jgi:hypothetical protein
VRTTQHQTRFNYLYFRIHAWTMDTRMNTFLEIYG